MDQAATVADGRRTEPLHVTVGGRSLALQVIVHYDFVVPDPTVELGQQSGGLLGDNHSLQVGPGKALDRIKRPPEGVWISDLRQRGSRVDRSPPLL